MLHAPLRRISSFVLDAVDGKNISKKEVFREYVDTAFEKYDITFSVNPPKVNIVVFELVTDGKFTDFLGSNAGEFEKYRLLGSQFLTICKDNIYKLRGGGYANFFILTKGDESVVEDLSNVFVAIVYFVYGRLNARLYHVSKNYLWGGEWGHRIFFPKQ